MNAMAEKLQAAGVDTVGARLVAACVEAIRHSPDSTVEAWRQVGYAFGHEFIRGLMGDMNGAPPVQVKIEPGIESKMPEYRYQTEDNRTGNTTFAHASVKAATLVPYKPRVVPPERLEKRRELQQIVRSKYKNSAGIAWSDVGWHELSVLKRDGKEAEALLAACGAQVPNDGRTVGEVLGVKRTDEVIAEARRS